MGCNRGAISKSNLLSSQSTFEILIYTEVLYAVLHAINDLLASQQVAHGGHGYHGADARAPEDFDIGQFTVGLGEGTEYLAAFMLVIIGLWHDLVVSLVIHIEGGDAVLFVEIDFVLAGQPADGGAD